MAGLYRGAGITLARDLPAFCLYFFLYERLRAVLAGEETGLSFTAATALAGALAGTMAWATEIPADSLHTRQQVYVHKTNSQIQRSF